MRLSLLLSIIIVCFNIHGQRFQQKWTLGVFTGVSQYVGDIYTPLEKMDSTVIPAIGFSAMYHANNRIGIVAYGQITGVQAADSNSKNPYWKERNLSFKSILLEGGARLEFAFLPYQVNMRTAAWAPYLSVGAFFSTFNPTTVFRGDKIQLSDYGTNEVNQYPLVMFGPTLGGGFKYNYKQNYTIGIHFDYKYTNTDYLDDISGNYFNPSDLLGSDDSEITLILHDRSLEKDGKGLADERKRRDRDNRNDRYFTLSVFGTYTFRQSYCPKPGGKSF